MNNEEEMKKKNSKRGKRFLFQKETSILLTYERLKKSSASNRKGKLAIFKESRSIGRGNE